MDSSKFWSWENRGSKTLVMNPRNNISISGAALLALIAVAGLTLGGCSKKSAAHTAAVNLALDVKTPFQFIAYGDTRFHDPKDTDAANPPVRVALVQAIAAANPAFICFTGDIVLNGNDKEDWKVFDSETAIWREKKITVYPALGNHDLHGSEKDSQRL
jgi:predicted MPP superfamily phosphohydrolase